MPILFQPSLQAGVPLWAFILTTVILVSGSVVVGWWNRKRSSSVHVEDQKTAAEATNLHVHSIAELLQELRETQTDVIRIGREQRLRAEEHRRQQQFSREQIIWHEEVTTIARQAAHAALNEVQRCIWAIKLRDDRIKEFEEAVKCAEDLLTENEIKFTKANLKEIPAFEQRSHESIVKYQSLPLPPKSVELIEPN